MTDPATGPAFRPADRSVELVETTVGALLTQRAQEDPDRLALVGNQHGSGAELRLTRAQLLEEAQRVATALRKVAEPGDLVALWAPNVVEWPIIEFGAALSGVVLVAVNPVFGADELEYVLQHSRSTVLLHADASRDHDMAAIARQVHESLPELRVISLSDRAAWRAAEIDRDVLATAPTNPGAPVMLQYTSGTTGRPKGVLLRHRSLVNNARLTMETIGVPLGAVCLNPLPMFHTAACVIGTLGPLWVGGTEVLVEQFVPGPVLETLHRERAAVLMYVPAVLGALIQAQGSATVPAPRLHTVLGGAATVPASMIEAAEQVFGASVINLYGQTELSPVLTTTRPDDARVDQLTTVGRPLPQVDVAIKDPATGEVVPLGVPGEICARGYQQLVEYLHDPGATSGAVDAEGFVHTGDLGAMDERGFIRLTGRLKELIIRKGENIAPAEVEIRPVAHPAVLEAAVVGIPDDQAGELVVAVLRLAGQEPGDLVEQLDAHCRATMAKFKVPARWFVTDALPLTPTMKVQKFRIVDLVAQGHYRELVRVPNPVS